MTIYKICPLKHFIRKSAQEKTDVKITHFKSRMHICRKLAYGMGGPPMQMMGNAMGFLLPIFLLETAKINPFYLSFIQIVARVWDAITDPISGYLVNRTRSRFGKFKPWMFTATPVSCLAFFLLFYVPNIENNAAKFVYYCFAVILVQSGLTAFHVPYSSMCMILTSNTRDRDELTSIRMAFEIVGVLFGAGVFGGIATANRIGNKEFNTTNITITRDMIDLERRDYMLASLAVCVIFLLCSITVLVGTKENEIIEDKDEPYFPNLKKIITFKPYLFLMFAFMFSSLGIQLVQSNIALYVTHTLKLPKHVIPGILVLLFCAFLLVPVGHVLLRRFGKKKIFFAGNINMIPMLASLAFLPEKLHLSLFYAYMVWTSFSVMVALVLPWSMLPDVIDLYMINNGCRMESTFYSFYVFFNKFAVGISLFFSAIVLGLAGYEVDKPQQSDSVSNMLRYYIGSSGIVCLSISMVFLYFYPIDEDERRVIANKLDKMRNDFLSSKIPMVSTFESELEIHCDKNPPTDYQIQSANTEAAKVVKNASTQSNVSFRIGSSQNLQRADIIS